LRARVVARVVARAAPRATVASGVIARVVTDRSDSRAMPARRARCDVRREIRRAPWSFLTLHCLPIYDGTRLNVPDGVERGARRRAAPRDAAARRRERA
jgi:hypothetical protein